MYTLEQKRFNAQLGIYETVLKQPISLEDAQAVENYYDTAQHKPTGFYLYVLSDGSKSREMFTMVSDLIPVAKLNQSKTTKTA